MGASGNKTSSDFIPALLISFTKIKEFSEYFKAQKDGKQLSKLFYSLIDNNFLDGNVFEFNKILGYCFGNIKVLHIDEIINFILQKLHEENNVLGKNHKEINEQNFSNLMANVDESEAYDSFKKYYDSNKSIIQDYFYREDEIISICSSCKTKFFEFKLEKMLHFNIVKYAKKKKDLKLTELLKDIEEKKIKNSFCVKCQKNNDLLSVINFKKNPEILIISFDNINNRNIIEYYLNMNVGNEQYILICIIIDKNENNRDVPNYNVFYKDKNTINKWYIYDTNVKETRLVKNIKDIFQNPLVCFYQKKITHIKIWVNKFYNQLKNLFQGLHSFQEKINKHITDEKNFEKCYVINKLWFNKLTKILEEEEIYNNKTTFESLNDVTNIYNLNNDQIKKIYEPLLERLEKLKDENIFNPEFEINDTSNIKYPKDFVLIPEKDLNDFLNEFNIEIIDANEMLYEMICGENYIFIKNKSNPNMYFVCYNLLFLLSVDKIFIFNEEKYFEREINLYIKNKGLESYYEERHLDYDSNVQDINDKENETIGQVISIAKNKTMMNLNKYLFNQNIKA